MPTIITDDGAVIYTPEPIRQDLAIPLDQCRDFPCPFCDDSPDEWSDDSDRTTRNNDTRTSEQVTAEAFAERETSYAVWSAAWMER